METNEFSSIWNHHKRLSQLFLIHLNTHVYGDYKYCYSYSAGIDFRRQILTTKVDPRAIRVKLLQSISREMSIWLKYDIFFLI